MPRFGGESPLLSYRYGEYTIDIPKIARAERCQNNPVIVPIVNFLMPNA
jgi:hypothetical protein